MKKYRNYFKNQYKVKFSNKDFVDHEKWFSAQWKFIKSDIKLNKNVRVLEIGSAYGGFYKMLKKDFPNVDYVGLELDMKAVEFSKKYFLNENFLNIPIESYNSNKKFDVVFAFEVLEHLEDPRKVMDIVYMLLKNSGYFIGTSPFPYKKNVYADKTHIYLLHPDNWRKLLQETLFSTIKMYPMSFVPYLWRFSRHLNFRLPFYCPLPYFISTSLFVARK